MKIRCHRTREELHALAPQWNALLRRSRSDAIFLTWEWISTWWDVFGERFSLLALSAEDDDGRLVGIAPTMVGPRRSATGLTSRALMIVGQRADTFAEYLDFIVEAGREAEVTAAFSRFFQHELAGEWDCVFFERILTTSPNLPVLRRTTSRPRFGAAADAELKSPHAVLGGSWVEFLAAKSRNFRNQWNNSWNRLQAAGDVQFLFGGQDLPLSTALAEVSRLHRQRWEGDSKSFATQAYLDFHERLCARLHANGWLLLLLLSVDGTNVAARYDYVYAGKVWCMQGGWSPEYSAKRVGTLLTGKVMEWGIAHGLAEYDFLGGDSDYKRRWANGERVMTNLTACNRRTLAGLAWECNRALEDVGRRLKRRLGARPAPAVRDAPAPAPEVAYASDRCA